MMNPRYAQVAKLGGVGLAMMTLVITAAAVRARTDDGPKETVHTLKVIVHVNFADASRQGSGLKNVANILKAAEAVKTVVDVEVVCHGDGIVLLEKAKTPHRDDVVLLQNQGVRFAACQNTMRQRSIHPDDLLAAVTTVPSGAFEVVRRQHEGFSYFKP